jgi:light-regulated signal transduction histidine kinase (bacteriophytochrome)
MKDQGQGIAPSLEAGNESVREFISIAAHDMREPLRAIRLGLQLLTANGDQQRDDNAARGAQYIERGAERLETLIRDIAEYCYEEVGDPDFRPIDLAVVLREARNGLAAELRAADATLTHDALPVVMGNQASLIAVLRCLIGNACKFRGEGAPRIHIEATLQGSEWVVSVCDNGLGFSAAYRERIFRPFERLNGKLYPGSGLGLALAKTIIERHGGRIWADSELGTGSTFRFSLPAAS